MQNFFVQWIRHTDVCHIESRTVLTEKAEQTCMPTDSRFLGEASPTKTAATKQHQRGFLWLHHAVLPVSPQIALIVWQCVLHVFCEPLQVMLLAIQQNLCFSTRVLSTEEAFPNVALNFPKTVHKRACCSCSFCKGRTCKQQYVYGGRPCLVIFQRYSDVSSCLFEHCSAPAAFKESLSESSKSLLHNTQHGLHHTG